MLKPFIISINDIQTMVSRMKQTRFGRIPIQVVTRMPKRSKTAKSAYNFKLVMMFTIKIDEQHYMPLAATVNR